MDFDLEKFFDRVNDDTLMLREASNVKDKRVLKLIRAYLEAGILDNDVVTASNKGTQGGLNIKHKTPYYGTVCS